VSDDIIEVSTTDPSSTPNDNTIINRVFGLTNDNEGCFTSYTLSDPSIVYMNCYFNEYTGNSQLRVSLKLLRVLRF
jgi:hypothetical protein